MRVNTIVVHYSATYEDQNYTVKDIDRMHKARGWTGVGYHWVIRRDGVVEQGRPETVVGAHVAGQNTGKIGICCIGGINRATGPNVGVDNRTPAQIESLIKLIRECLKRHPGAKVVGHRDLANTQCPGFDVATWWARVQKTKLPPPPTEWIDAPVTTPGVGEDVYHIVEKGETWFGIAREHGVPLVSLLSLNDATDKDVLTTGRRLTVRRATLRTTSPAPSTQKPSPARPAPAPISFWAALLRAIFGRN